MDQAQVKQEQMQRLTVGDNSNLVCGHCQQPFFGVPGWMTNWTVRCTHCGKSSFASSTMRIFQLAIFGLMVVLGGITCVWFAADAIRGKSTFDPEAGEESSTTNGIIAGCMGLAGALALFRLIQIAKCIPASKRVHTLRGA